MAHRTFFDDEGAAWQVWDVRPHWAERRLEERRVEPAPVHSPERREGERRTIEERRPSVSPDLCRGWLTFQSPQERRRLAPVPVGWEDLEDEALLGLLRAAKPVTHARKRLIE